MKKPITVHQVKTTFTGPEYRRLLAMCRRLGLVERKTGRPIVGALVRRMVLADPAIGGPKNEV